MAAARLAPVLSATSRIERICNIIVGVMDGSLNSYRRHACARLNNLHQTPALGLRERPGFLDPHSIAHFCFTLFIVRVKLFVPGNDLFVTAMRKAALDPNDD